MLGTQLNRYAVGAGERIDEFREQNQSELCAASLGSILKLIECGLILSQRVHSTPPTTPPCEQQTRILFDADHFQTTTLVVAVLGTAIDSRRMIILTNAPYAYRIFGTSKQSPIGRMDIHMAQQLLDEGHSAGGSMRPKIEAAIQFSGRP